MYVGKKVRPWEVKKVKLWELEFVKQQRGS
jgi:hypothetical protein